MTFTDAGSYTLSFNSMKRSFASLVVSLLLVSCGNSNAYPQTQDGCSLTSWIWQQKPHSTRTTELPFDLRDTVVTIGTTSHKISIPAGFTMTVFGKVTQARGLALSPDGVVYATSYANGGQIFALPDHNHDGVPDSTILVASGLGDPHGIGFYHGELYVSNNSTLYHLVDTNHDRIAESKVKIAALPPGGGHTTRNFVFDTIQNKILLQVGSEGNTDTTDLAHRAQIMMLNIDGSGARTYSRGIRNGVGLDLDPRTNALWVNNNGMDELFGKGAPATNNNPSECIYIACDGANYGWPWAYGFQMRNPMAGWVSLDTNIIRTFDGPVAEVLAHSAPLGLHFYRGSALPAKYHNAIFQCYHGSWNRTPAAPARITVMWADSTGQNARVTDFVNGFQPDSSGNRWGRVVSVIEGKFGELYVSDDAAGIVYRIVYTGIAAPKALAIDNSNITGKTFAPRQSININWTGAVGDSIQMFIRTSEGASFIPIGNGLNPPSAVTIPDFLNTSTAQFRLLDKVTGAESISEVFSIHTLGVTSTNMDRLSVESIHPNPASAIATIAFRLPHASRVNATLIDLLGNTIRTVSETEFPAGAQSIVLDLKGIAPGNYFIRFQADNQTVTERLSVK